MDDFRVGSLFRDPYRDPGSSDSKNRKKAKRPEAGSGAEEDIVSLSENEAPEQSSVDFYSPSDLPKDTE
jgi:hypothetical protein